MNINRSPNCLKTALMFAYIVVALAVAGIVVTKGDLPDCQIYSENVREDIYFELSCFEYNFMFNVRVVLVWCNLPIATN